jgi:predicted porin
MKKSLLALAVLGVFASAASAQSSVTLYGKVDLGVGRGIGEDHKFLANGAGSRLGVRGVEDLGGGLQALFNIEHRFEADTGRIGTTSSSASNEGTGAAAQANTRFWHGRSIVGMQGGWGQVVFGREYTPAFLQVQLVADPFGYDTVAQPVNTSIIGLGLHPIRNDSSVTYKISMSGFTFGAQVAEASDVITNVPNKPISFALSYAAGPITAGISYERPGQEAATTRKLLNLNAAYNFGAFKVGGAISRGTTETDLDRTGWLLTATAPVGAGEARLALGRRKDDLAGGGDTTVVSGFAAGYHYNMSKRTKLYADIARNSKVSDNKTGYDVGIQHNF